MRDYRQQTAGLRGAAKGLREIDMPKTAEQMEDAADAIEDLLAKLTANENSGKLLAAAFERLKEKVPKWIMIESRPMDKEERDYYSERYDFPLNEDEAVIYCCPLPEHGQEVLVLNRYGRIWLDTFDDDPDYGVGFETNGDMDGIVAWMPLPAPPKGVE